jgi:hypothetical protein
MPICKAPHTIESLGYAGKYTSAKRSVRRAKKLIDPLPRDTGKVEDGSAPYVSRSVVADLGVTLIGMMVDREDGTPLVPADELATLVRLCAGPGFEFSTEAATNLNQILFTKQFDALYESDTARRVVEGIPALLAAKVNVADPWFFKTDSH